MRVRPSTSVSNGTSAQPCSPHGRARLPSTATSGEALKTNRLVSISIRSRSAGTTNEIITASWVSGPMSRRRLVSHPSPMVCGRSGRNQGARIGIEVVRRPFDTTALFDARDFDGYAGPQRRVRDDFAVGAQPRDAAIGLQPQPHVGIPARIGDGKSVVGVGFQRSGRHDRRPLYGGCGGVGIHLRGAQIH
jgi:hypothetical protein